MIVNSFHGLDTSTRFVPFVDVHLYESMDSKVWDIGTHRSLVLELNGINVQPFHLRVKGGAVHSQSIGRTRYATNDSAGLFQSLQDELALDLWGQLARRWLLATSQFLKWNAQNR